MIDKSELEIMESWKGDKFKPLVSICSLAYNHEAYIMDALDSFLMQETDFPFEIIIHDDASTDSTQNIIKEYEKKFPSIVKAIYQTENKYSQGIRPSLSVFEKVQGEFMAICEGDDYWCDPYKLKKQITLLKQYPLINFSFHASIRHDICESVKTVTGDITKVIDFMGEDAFSMQSIHKNLTYGYIKNSKYHSYCAALVPTENIILKTHYGFIETSSYIIRSTVLPNIIQFFHIHPYVPIGDFYIEILASDPYGGLFINNVMSVYRLKSSKLSWSSKVQEKARDVEYYNKLMPTFKLMDQLTESKYTQSFHNSFYKRMYSAYTRDLNESFWYEYYEKILDQMIDSLKNGKSNYVLYGYGTVGKRFYRNMPEQIVGVFDKLLDEIDVANKFLNSEQLRSSNEPIIISAISATEVIMKDLMDMGICKTRLIDLTEFYPPYIPFIEAYELSITKESCFEK